MFLHYLLVTSLSVQIEKQTSIQKLNHSFFENKCTFRNRLCRYDVISDIVCGIVNFKIRWKQEFIVIP